MIQLNFRSQSRFFLLCSITILLGACGGNTIARTGFIPTSVSMQKSKSDEDTSTFKAKDFLLSQYGSVKVELAQSDKLADSKMKPEEVEALRTRFQASLQKALQITGGTGPRVLVVRAELTAFKPNNPLLNVAPQTQIMKRGYGYAACEIYATDGVGGPVVVAYMNTADTQRFGTEKMSEYGTIEKACDNWGPAFRKYLTD